MAHGCAAAHHAPARVARAERRPLAGNLDQVSRQRTAAETQRSSGITLRRIGGGAVFVALIAAVWAMTRQPTPEAPVAAPPLQGILAEQGPGEADPGEPERGGVFGSEFWMTGTQQREQARKARHRELAAMIEDMAGIESASVVVSEADPRSGLGQSRTVPTASVVITPTRNAVPPTLVNAIAHLVAGATGGLEARDVEVVDARNGHVCSRVELPPEHPDEQEHLATTLIQSLGLPPSSIDIRREIAGGQGVFIPWRNPAAQRWAVTVTLPRSWVAEKDATAAFRSIRHAILATATEETPRITLRLAPTSGKAHAAADTGPDMQQIALLLALAAILLSGWSVARRRSTSTAAAQPQLISPSKSATRLLRMTHDRARGMLESMPRHRRMDVLRAIVKNADTADNADNELPTVEVPRAVDRRALRTSVVGMEDNEVATAIQGLDRHHIRSVLGSMPPRRSRSIRQLARQLPPQPLCEIEVAKSRLFASVD